MHLSFKEYLTERNRFESRLYDELKKYSNDASYFVTFTSLEKVGINPVNAFSTPIGVYAYSLKDLWKHWIAGDFFFGRDRPFVNLLKVSTSKILHLKNYRFNSKDLAVLKSRYEDSGKSDISFDEYLQAIRDETSRSSNLYSNASDGAVLWNLTYHLASADGASRSKAFTVRWNSLFRELGYDAIYDTSSIIHLLQSSQAVFFTPSSYKLVKRFVNKPLVVNDSPYWGTSEQPFWYPGENPAVDILLTAPFEGERRALLIKRKGDSSWALPGAFLQSDSDKGEPFMWGRETPKQAAVRVLTEETKLYLGNIRDIGNKMTFVGKFDSMTRDPRNNEESWAASYFFSVSLDESDGVDLSKYGAQAGAADAKWFSAQEIPKLAFDHNALIKKILK
jgi:8-oxo-dGTP diphosphatase